MPVGRSSEDGVAIGEHDEIANAVRWQLEGLRRLGPGQHTLDAGDGLQLSITDAADGRTHTWRIDLPPLEQPGFDPDMAKLLSSTPPAGL